MAVLKVTSRETHDVAFDRGNFGLWYNKHIPLNDNFKACDGNGDKDNALSSYLAQYNKIKTFAGDLLEKKHGSQADYLRCMERTHYAIEMRAKLVSPLVTGIGQQHPTEVSMVFDYTTGMPYIPASSVKGLVRFAYTLGLLRDEAYSGEEFYSKDENGVYLNEEKTPIKELFGWSGGNGKANVLDCRGGIVFLDAYPSSVPELHLDILNPHYPKYYKGESFPADNQDPNPVRFLTVKKGTTFVFRALVSKKIGNRPDTVREAMVRALRDEGAGAKTATGYGRFAILDKTGGEQSPAKGGTAVAAPVRGPDPKENETVVVEVLGISKDRNSVEVMLPNGKKTQFGKNKLALAMRNELKSVFKPGKKITVKVVKVMSGNYTVEFVSLDAK